jgi:hypothetical protein
MPSIAPQENALQSRHCRFALESFTYGDYSS